MRRRFGSLWALPVALLAGGLVALSAPSAGGAGGRVARPNDLAARAHAALLQLYSIETRLTAARDRLASLERRTASIERRRAAVRKELGIATRAEAVSRRRLAQRLRELYEQGETDPVAVVLGANSLDEALTGIDDLNRAARLDQHVIQETQDAQRRLARLARSLDSQSARLERARRAAATTAAALGRAREQRVLYVADLQERQRLNARAVARISTMASAASAKTTRIAPPPPVVPAATPANPDEPAAGGGGRTLTVVATGYSLSGATATGIPAGYGVVAVDPAVIPLGTRLSIPGYGEGVAADIGSAIRGATIDLWFPTRAQARTWGRRPVVVTLH